jgi:N-acyl-D-amino-acid deacylase
MSLADIFIHGGVFFGMAGEPPRPASVVVKDGKIEAVLPPGAKVEADEVFDAKGMIVAPGFVDIHIHDEYFPDADTVQHCLIRQGVTTAVAGNCGSGPAFGEAVAARSNPWLNLSYLVGNRAALREKVGCTDHYTAATPGEIEEMRALLRESLEEGAMGLSLGLEYAPGTSREELDALAAVVAGFGNRIVTAHIRYDDDRSVGAVEEIIDLSRRSRARCQISHLGSMTMGRTRECEELIEGAAADGVDVGFDCYPYDAFCANAGSAVYDDGFVQRWKGKGPECLMAVSGKFKGRRLTFETLAETRKNEPDALVVAHVMDREEVENCLANPRCVIASDALTLGGGAHPRVAGTFPRAFRVLRERGYGWEEILRKATVMPAESVRLEAGRLYEGAPADVVVFDPNRFIDRATFQEPFLPPEGLELVLIGGRAALKDRKISPQPCGSFHKAPL